MQHIFWLIPNCLAGRPGPTYKPWSVPEIRNAGIDTIINLSEFASDDQVLKVEKINSFWIPLPTTVPADDTAERVCMEMLPKAYSILKTELDAGHRVLVHCNGGRDRTCMLLAYHLAVAQSLAAMQAIGKVRLVRPIALAADGWEAMAVRVIDRLTLIERPSDRNLALIREAVDDKDILDSTRIINTSFATVAEEFGFTKMIAPTFPAYITSDMLKYQVENGLKLNLFIKDGIPVGCVGFNDADESGTAKIARLAVLPEHRHQGIGEKLMNFAINEIVQRGGKRALVEIVNENTKLKDWYIKFGFHEMRIDTYEHLPFTVSVLDKSIGS